MYGRAKVPVDARAAGVDLLTLSGKMIADVDGLEKDSIFGRKLGYTGKCIIHPSQIDHVHKIFSPTTQDIQWAKKVISALDESIHGNLIKTGAINLEGKMIDIVHYKIGKKNFGFPHPSSKNYYLFLNSNIQIMYIMYI